MPGSVYRRKDGYWCAAITVGGKRLVRYARTRKEAEERLIDLLTETRLGVLQAPTRVTLAEWWDSWLGLTERRPKTVETYNQAVQPVLKVLGNTRLDRLTAPALAATFAALRGKHGTRLVQQAYAYLKTSLGQAVGLGLLRANPMDRVQKPRHEPRERPTWNLQDCRRFLEVCERSASRYAPLLALALLTGLRRGELFGLRGRDIDWETRTITVERQVTFVNGQRLEGPLKTRAARRVVPLPGRALLLLRQLPCTDEALFPDATPTGAQSALRRLCRQAGLPAVSLHDLRRFYVTLIIGLGADVKVAQRLLGHSRASTTLDIYARLLQGRDREATERLDRALGG